MNAREAIKTLTEEDLLKKSLQKTLLLSFQHHGYSYQECSELAEIAIGPIQHALDLAHAAYKFHLEAVQTDNRASVIYL